jgi:hypothetical protein
VPTTLNDLPAELLLKILSFVPGRALLSTVPLVSQKFSTLVKDASLWEHVYFHSADSPGYISSVLARFKDSIRTVTLESNGADGTEKINLLVDSKIAFEQVHFITDGKSGWAFDLDLVFQLLGESTRVLSFREQLRQCQVMFSRDPFIRLQPRVQVLPETQLVSLDLSATSDVNDGMIAAIVSSCSNLELLHLGHCGALYTGAGIRAIADGLPNLVSFFSSQFKDEDEAYRYLLSKKPGLAAFGFVGSSHPLPRTVAHMPRMTELQYLQLVCPLDGKTLRAMFENANFPQLKSLGLGSIVEFDSGALKAMALACPELEQLALLGQGWSEAKCLVDDATVKFIVDWCPKLRFFCIPGSNSITGEGWLDGIGTHLQRAQCVVMSFHERRDEVGPEFQRRADTARSLYPKLRVIIGRTPYQYNEKVSILDRDVLAVLGVLPRPCDLQDRRVRFSDILQEAARSKSASEHRPLHFW